LAGGLGWFWFERAKGILGLEYLKDVENCPAEASLTKARALISQAILLFTSGNIEGLLKVDFSLELWDHVENREIKAKSLMHYVFVKAAMQDYEAAMDTAMELEEIALELDDKYLLLQSKTAQLFVYVCQLQVDLAEPLAVQNLKDVVALDDHMTKPFNLHYYSDCALMRKDFKEAEERYSAAAQGYLDNGNRIGAGVELQGMAFAISGQGRYMKALRLLGAVDAQYDEIGYTMPMILFWIDWYEEYANGARKAVGEEKAAQYEQEGREMGFEHAVDYALKFKLD
jgi:hypothetical protein